MPANNDDNSKGRGDIRVGSDVVFGSDVVQGGNSNLDGDGDAPVDVDDDADDELLAAPTSNSANVGADFAGRDLSGSQFDGCNFEDADFAGATLRGTNFREAEACCRLLELAYRSAAADGARLPFREPLPPVNGGTAASGG